MMSEVVTPEVTVDAAAEYARAIEQMFAEMKRANEQMARDQEEIEGLKARTCETLARLEAASRAPQPQHLHTASQRRLLEEIIH